MAVRIMKIVVRATNNKIEHKKIEKIKQKKSKKSNYKNKRMRKRNNSYLGFWHRGLEVVINSGGIW